MGYTFIYSELNRIEPPASFDIKTSFKNYLKCNTYKHYTSLNADQRKFYIMKVVFLLIIL
jgi:hypothetical protein